MFFFFQAEDGIRDLVRSRGLGDVYKRQHFNLFEPGIFDSIIQSIYSPGDPWLTAADFRSYIDAQQKVCLLYTSDAADERSSVDLGGRRIIKKKKSIECRRDRK